MELCFNMVLYSNLGFTMKILMQAISNVHASRRFLPLAGLNAVEQGCATHWPKVARKLKFVSHRKVQTLKGYCQSFVDGQHVV